MRMSVGVFGGWSVPAATASANTAFVQLIQPNTLSRDPNNAPNLYPIGSKISGSSNPNLAATVRRAGWFGTQGEPTVGVTHVTDLVYTTGNTANNLYLLQPLNWTYTTAASAQNTNTITLAYDPGAYSVNYAYSNGLFQGQLADNLIANTDYVSLQLADGSWFTSKVSAFNTTTLVLTLVTATPATTTNTAGGVLINTPVFWYGAPTDRIPATGFVQWTTVTALNTTRQQIINRGEPTGAFSALRAGDPVLFYSDNATGVGSLDFAGGFYGKW